ncbi:5-hydroxytryptamine receptor 3A-like [Spea bombifrons]|uniref:5-hydroxytryptamine receptor 3A-like n=1 Tax=Spea bombifrons TaxID=233779 RepID=UPI00234AEE68|nr:5-hydroxytryptamine receptor 3A-like [Spea bombifrons]
MLAVLACLYLQLVVVLGQNACGYYDVTDALGIFNESPTLMYVRPVKNWKETSFVAIDVIFRAILDMDEKLQTLTTLMDFEMIWQNQLLSWDPQEFCGIKRVPIPVASVWTPDIYVSETTQDDSLDSIYLLLYHNGSVQRFKTLRLVTTCSLDLYKFPFDSQKCNLTFGMTVAPATDVVMAPTTNANNVTDLSKIMFSNGEWSLQDIDIFVANVSRRGEEWSNVIYQIHVKRAPILYVINLIIPACLLVFVDVASMFIPMEGGERLGFKITVVLGFSVLLLILNDFLPNTDNPPILGVFCMVCLLIMIISIMDSIFISYMLYLSTVRSSVPNWLRLWVLKRLAFVLCIETNVHIVDSKTVGVQNKGMLEQEAVLQEVQTGNPTGKDKDNPESKLLKRILLELLMVRRHLIATKNEEESKSEWKVVAFVLDRFILILYLLIVTLIMVVVVVVWAF